MINTKVDLAAAERIKEELDSLNQIKWTEKNLGRCLNEYRAIVPIMGSIQETIDYVKGLKNRPQGQGFSYFVGLNMTIEFTVTCDSSD